MKLFAKCVVAFALGFVFALSTKAAAHPDLDTHIIGAGLGEKKVKRWKTQVRRACEKKMQQEYGAHWTQVVGGFAIRNGCIKKMHERQHQEYHLNIRRKERRERVSPHFVG